MTEKARETETDTQAQEGQGLRQREKERQRQRQQQTSDERNAALDVDALGHLLRRAVEAEALHTTPQSA